MRHDDAGADTGAGPPAPGGADRLDELEREHERLRGKLRRLRLAVAALAVAAAVPLVAAAAPDGPAGELEVRELRVVGEDGTPRLVLSSQISQEALFYGRRVIRNSPDAAGVVFHDGDGQEQGAIAVPDAGGIGMGLDSKTGQNGGLFVSPDGRSMDFSFWTTRGQQHRLSLGIDTDEGPSLEMVRAGEPVLRLPRADSAGASEGEGPGE